MSVNYRKLDCPPEDVFAILADGWVYPGWVVGASAIRAVNRDWPEQNSEIHHSFGIWPVLVTDKTSMLEWNPPRHALLKARAWPAGEAHVAIDVKPRSDGCVVRMIEDVVAGPARLVPKVVRDTAAYLRNVETLNRLAYLAEGYSRAPETWAVSGRAADATAARSGSKNGRG